MTRLKRNLVGAVLMGSVIAASSFAGFVPLVNGSCTDEEMSTWQGGARDTVVYYSAPASLRIANSTADAYKNGANPAIWSGAINSTGGGWPVYALVEEFMAKQDGVSSARIYNDILIFNNDYSKNNWMGAVVIDLYGDPTWQPYYDSTDYKTAKNSWESTDFVTKSNTWLSQNGGKGNLSITMRVQSWNGTTWYDDYAVRYAAPPNPTAVGSSVPYDKIQKAMKMIPTANGMTAQFSTPVNYTLTVLGAQGKVVATQKGYGAYAIAPKNLSNGNYILKVTADKYGTIADRMTIVK